MASAYGRASYEDLRHETLIQKEDINILILGETGVGKSTWINGIANYAKHNSLQDAMDDPEFTVLIPSRFFFIDGEGNEIEITFGNDANEDLTSVGQSATQSPREYMLETNTTRFHLIDTPGIGDCRGIEKDRENFENILVFLTNYDKINAVVVLLKSNNSRLTVAFRFCVLELLTHLHKSLVSNIIFAFTNARGTFYRPGDSLPVLKKLLKEYYIGINLSPSNYFCFDNEAFRLLAGHKRGIQYTPHEIDLYSESWVQSCDTTLKLLDLVTTMKPHETKKTLSLNEARDCIIAMSKPMDQAVQLIEQHKTYTATLVGWKLERKIREFEDEKEYIFECASHFGVFLKENAMIVYNDSFSEYLDMLIRDEQAKERVIRDERKIDQMKRDKQTHKEEKNAIETTITLGSRDKNEVIPIEKIYEMIQKLCTLKHNGKTLKDALGEIVQRQLREMQQREQNSQRQIREMRQREQNLQRQLREMAQREENLQTQLREIAQRAENSQRQLTLKDRQVNELQLSVSTAQKTISELRRGETCDWVIPRDEIQLTDRCLGKGAWGSVYEGKYCGCAFAVKQIHDLILSPHCIRLFKREMNIASKCRHPSLLQFIGATNDRESPLFVTELMETSLRALLEQRKLSDTEIAVITLDVARALSYLHQKKPEPIIHRDISSTNVLLWRHGDQWRGKVSDYGTANFVQHTMTVAPGAAIYCAPEALTSNQTVKTDVYSFGVLLCEMCIGELPDPSSRDEQVVLVTNHVFRDLVRRCLQTNPEMRPNMQQIVDQLEEFNTTSHVTHM